ncbi:hypothetical protein F5Y14DRAFT_64191 [Nemania sp. NC0429]|nr:hypothetical protein F5Y14DRAFT_64191 [Nemania sp. NC0429]
MCKVCILCIIFVLFNHQPCPFVRNCYVSLPLYLRDRRVNCKPVTASPIGTSLPSRQARLCRHLAFGIPCIFPSFSAQAHARALLHISEQASKVKRAQTEKK